LAPITLRIFWSQDLIDLSAIDANSVADGNQAFHAVEEFSGEAGELRLFTCSSGVRPGEFFMIAQGDIDGDGGWDFEILVEKPFSIDLLSASDFIL